VPTWAQGKTAGEVLNLAQQMEQALRSTQAPAPPPPAATYPPPVAGYPSDDEFLVRPREATARVAEQLFADRMAPALAGMQGMASMFATNQRMFAEGKFPEEFRKYGPEIDALMVQATPEQRTFDNYEKVVTFIRGKHMDEIAAERAQRLVAQGGLGERSGGTGLAGTPQTSGVDFAKLPQGIGKIAERVGLTEVMVRDFCKANNMTPEQWMQQALNEQVVTSTAPFSFEIRDDKLGVRRGFDS
jgi:AraC-like DNA-binding protein